MNDEEVTWSCYKKLLFYLYYEKYRMGKPWNLKIILTILDDDLDVVGHSFIAFERNIPTFICNILCNYYFICE